MSSFNKNIKAVRSLAMVFLNRLKIFPLMKKGFFTNKYTLSVFILLAILATDILLHKGMSRVILPESFTNQRAPQTGLPHCTASFIIKEKHWKKAVNNDMQLLAIDSNVSGIEMDVYFDTAQNDFFVYHDTSVISATSIEDIFSVIKERNLSPSVWLDFKNLEEYSKIKAVQYLRSLENKYGLHNRLMVESQNIAALQTFCDSGFFTSYYVPFFNPYSEKENVLVSRIDSISAALKKYPVSALSGYYFQVPFLKKFFPAFPILTWTEDSNISLVNKYFNYQLERDEQVKIILHNIDN